MTPAGSVPDGNDKKPRAWRNPSAGTTTQAGDRGSESLRNHHNATRRPHATPVTRGLRGSISSDRPPSHSVIESGLRAGRCGSLCATDLLLPERTKAGGAGYGFGQARDAARGGG